MRKAFFDTRDRADHRMKPDTFDGRKWTHKRMDSEGVRLRFMARSGGYVMVRRPRCYPFVLTEKEWAKLPVYEESTT